MAFVDKQHIRKQVRTLRKQLSSHQQQVAATHLCRTIVEYVEQTQAGKIALFLSMDGEIDTMPTINALWQANLQVYLPVIHPFNRQHLLFIRYQPDTPLTRSPLGMLEPKVECQHICPLAELDMLFTPLVAFDALGHRLGMGGGFYDRTLAMHYKQQSAKPAVIGLAHDCQQVECIPTESWDIPLTQIITPSRHFRCAPNR